MPVIVYNGALNIVRNSQYSHRGARNLAQASSVEVVVLAVRLSVVLLQGFTHGHLLSEAVLAVDGLSIALGSIGGPLGLVASLVLSIVPGILAVGMKRILALGKRVVSAVDRGSVALSSSLILSPRGLV